MHFIRGLVVCWFPRYFFCMADLIICMWVRIAYFSTEHTHTKKMKSIISKTNNRLFFTRFFHEKLCCVCVVQRQQKSKSILNQHMENLHNLKNWIPISQATYKYYVVRVFPRIFQIKQKWARIMQIGDAHWKIYIKIIFGFGFSSRILV